MLINDHEIEWKPEMDRLHTNDHYESYIYQGNIIITVTKSHGKYVVHSGRGFKVFDTYSEVSSRDGYPIQLLSEMFPARPYRADEEIICVECDADLREVGFYEEVGAKKFFRLVEGQIRHQETKLDNDDDLEYHWYRCSECGERLTDLQQERIALCTPYS